MNQDPQSGPRKCCSKCGGAGRALGALAVVGLVAALAFHAGREAVSSGSEVASGTKLAAQSGDDIPTLYPR